MESNRDDFVIAIRSAFLKKETQQRFSLLGLIVFSIIFLVLGSFNFKAIDYLKSGIKEVVYRSSFIVSGPEIFLQKSYVSIKSHFDLYKENEKNKLELKSFKSKDLLNEFIVLENKRLKTIIDDFLIVSNEIIAKVLIDKNSPFLRSIVANKGSKDNVKLGMIVLDGDYIVGKIIEVNYLTSRILLLSDLNSKIPVVIEPSGFQSILSGTGDDNGIIQYIQKGNTISKDSTVYTSGSGGLFKPGIPIGRINNLDYEEKNTVDFFSDFSQLHFVKIVSYEKSRIKVEEQAKIKRKKENELKAEEDRIKAEKEANLKAEEDRINAEKEARLKAEEDRIKAEEDRIKAEKEARLKTENEAILKTEKDQIFKELEFKYKQKCKKNFFNNLYKVGTPEYKKCILNKGKKI